MNLTELTGKITELKKLMQTEGQAALKSGFREFFDANPEVDRIAWTQFTPYFNDGDTCTFSVGDFGFFKSDTDDTEYDLADSYSDMIHELSRIDISGSYAKYYPDAGKYRDLTERERQLIKNCNDFKNQLGKVDDILETVFGDHVMVVATKNGFEVSEHDHE